MNNGGFVSKGIAAYGNERLPHKPQGYNSETGWGYKIRYVVKEKGNFIGLTASFCL